MRKLNDWSSLLIPMLPCASVTDEREWEIERSSVHSLPKCVDYHESRSLRFGHSPRKGKFWNGTGVISTVTSCFPEEMFRTMVHLYADCSFREMCYLRCHVPSGKLPLSYLSAVVCWNK